MTNAGLLHGVSWIAQFLGHGLAEKRAPALLDNLVGGRLVLLSSCSMSLSMFTFAAVVLAPFFVHLELLFGLGYKPELHKRIQNDVGKEIARIKKEAGEKRRAAGKKEL